MLANFNRLSAGLKVAFGINGLGFVACVVLSLTLHDVFFVVAMLGYALLLAAALWLAKDELRHLDALDELSREAQEYEDTKQR